MNPIIDLANSATWVNLFPGASVATNNTASAGVDLSQFEGRPALSINIGLSTAGTTPGVTVLIQTSATNAAANAVNFTGTNLSPITNPTSNNAAAVLSQVPIDVRAANRYLFIRAVITGTNSPAFPITATLVGTKKAQ